MDPSTQSAGRTRRHRLQVRFDVLSMDGIRARAGKTGVSLSGAVRDLVAAGLTFDTEPGPRPDSPATLAALVAAEHAVLMVAAVLPDGQRRRHELAPDAALAAEERLALFREAER